MGTLIAAARPALLDPTEAAAPGAERVCVPYGVAIAAAALVVIIPSNFN
jgi:hypothetical protein